MLGPINPVSRRLVASAPPGLSPPRSRAVVPDRVELSGSPPPAPPARPWLRQLAQASLFVAVALGTFLPATLAQAAPQAASQDLERARDYGLSESTALTLLAQPAHADSLRTLPPALMARFRDLSPAQKGVMHSEMQGSSWGQKHRDLFVKGQAPFGIDAFNKMKGHIDKHVPKRITASEAEALKADVEVMRTLTPAQRASIAEVILLEMAPR